MHNQCPLFRAYPSRPDSCQAVFSAACVISQPLNRFPERLKTPKQKPAPQLHQKAMHQKVILSQAK